MWSRRGPSGTRRARGPLASGCGFLIGLFCLAAAVLPSSAEEPLLLLSPLDEASPPEIQVLERTSHGVLLQIEVRSLVVEEISGAGQTYQRVSIPGGAELGAVGAPALSVFSRLVQAPANAQVRITARVASEEEIPGIRLAPYQDEEAVGFDLDPASYARDDFGSEPAARVEGSVRMRDLNVRPLIFSPLRYNPAQRTLRIARRLEVRVEFEGGEPSGAWVDPSRPLAPSFDRLYRRLVVNYDGPPPGVRVENGTWLCISVNNAGVLSRLQPLADWHKRRGLPTRIVTTAETGTTTTSIHNYIQNAYDTWEDPPEYIVLAGDATGSYALPCYHTGGGEGDHPYTQLAGNDLIGDAHIGRLSFTDTAQLDVIVAKSIGYPSNPSLADPAWFTRATLVGDPSHSGYSTVQVMQWIKTRLRQVGYTGIDTIFGGSWVGLMRSSLSRGETVFCYRGYYGMSGWSNTDTNALTNYWKLPFSVHSTCGTGSFDGSTAISEGFLRAGTAEQPKGAIGAIGTATLSTHTRYNNCYTMGVWQGVFYEDQWEMGAAHTRGKTELVLNYGVGDPGAATNFSTWNNLMGDPACQVWTAFPEALTAVYASPIPVGATSFTVRVSETEGQGCAGAQVCLWKGSEIYAVGTTDDQGFCELALAAPTAGTAKLTVTKHNRRPILLDVPVAQASEFVGFAGLILDDDQNGESFGNGDGRIEPGESLELGVQLRNLGEVSAPSVLAHLSSEDPYVIIADADEEFGTIPAGETAWSVEDFDFSVLRGCPDGHVLRFALDVSAGGEPWHSMIELPVASARLAAGAVTVTDGGNGRLDPGETAEVTVSLVNEGGVNAQEVNAVLSSLSPWVSVLDPSGVYGSIGIGQTVSNPFDRFTVRAAADTYAGHLAFFQIVTMFNGGATDTTITSLVVGTAGSDDPVGPDAYGYYAFDNTDTAYPEAPVYEWLEVNPQFGGTGTQVQLGDYASYQDKSLGVNLPFTFQFYGRTYTRATICSNGWIAMGDTYLTEYRNWSIPGAGAPQNLIAAFWDDLRETTSGGHVYQRYDEANHLWIVEWSRMINEINSAQETFEMILYDPAFYPTETGDGIIVFQYNVVNQVDGTDGYATTGIQNWDHTVGLLYTYYNRYPATAAPLAAGRAIRFIPRRVDVTGAEDETARPLSLSLAQAQPNPFSAGTNLSFTLPEAGSVRLSLFDPQGRRVRSLLSGSLPAGAQTVRWDGRDDAGRSVPAGIYFVRMDAGGQSLVRKLMRLE